MAEAASNECDKRPMFGARHLDDPKHVFHHNVWDNVQWDSEQEKEAQKQVEKQAVTKIKGERKEQLQAETGRKWDIFYDLHQNRFFKDRHWLFTEFPELKGTQKLESKETPVRVFPADAVTLSEGSSTDVKPANNIFEIGCGVGNTVFPILDYNINPDLMVFCCDFSSNAISILKSHTKYDPKRCNAFVCDITEESWKTPFPPSNIDITTLIFALSAVPPEKMQHVVNQVYHYMQPGGLVLFRDYGRYDMAQLRFKEGQMMDDNFYLRKDGTFVYFFTQENVRSLFTNAGFSEELNYIDRRLQVNRLRQLKMYRVWVQAKYRKPMS